jgi:hypothetical protein
VGTGFWSVTLLCLLFLTGCRAPSQFPKFDTAQPGWTQREYQVVWKPQSKGGDMVCDVVEGRHPDGRVFLEVSKPPLTLVSVRVAGPQWWIEYGPRPRAASGRIEDKKIAHLWVLAAIRKTNDVDLKVEVGRGDATTWKSASRGEQIEGIPAP